MKEISLRQLFAVSFIAALVGSSVGTILLAADDLLGNPLRRLMGETGRHISPSMSDVLVNSSTIWMISLFGTIPGSVIVGIPAIYFFRSYIARNPAIFILPVAVYAALLGMALLGWTVTPTAYGAKHYEVIWFYSAGCGIGFVMALGWWTGPAKCGRPPTTEIRM